MNLLLIAWRNLWRNKRRTLITAASVFFAIWFALIMRAFQLGSYEVMVNNIVHAFSGYFQLHAKGYWDDKTLNNAFSLDTATQIKLRQIQGVEDCASRLESFALASYGARTKGVMVIGVDPESEEGLTSLRQKLREGAYLTPNANGALISRRLASYLKTAVGDTLVIIGQGYQGTSAAGIFPVKGIISFPSPDLDGRLIYLSLPAARELFGAPGMLTTIAFNVSGDRDYKKVSAEVDNLFSDDQYEVMTWEEMMPEVVQQIRADSASGLIMLGILYMIVGFGIFGTILMMLNERRREFGMMIAVGMQKRRLLAILITEIMLLGLIGLITGVAAAVPVIRYYHLYPVRLTGSMAESIISMGFEPVMPTAWNSSFFIAQSLVVMGIVLLVMFLPVVRIRKLKVINALKR